MIACAISLAARGDNMHAGMAKGLDVETAIKRYKTDRRMLDLEFTFVSA